MARWYIAVILSIFHTLLAQAHDLTALPLGDGKLTSAPKVGWIWPCRTEPDAGGAWQDGPWIDKNKGTYDLTRKAVVPGAVTWPSRYSIHLQGDKRVFIANDLPSHATGTYPVPSNSEAYRYDRNPNRIKEQTIQISLPANPELAAQPTCVPGGIGFLLSGSVLFNALDAPGRDAVAHETQDSCQGHPQVSGVYHYHNVSTCVDTKREQDGHSALVGYLLDGFGIYGRYGENGKLLTSQDLDECHGHTHEITWDGKRVKMYHYHATWDFPYTAGCMRGKYSMRDVMTISGSPPADRMRPQTNGNMGNASGAPNGQMRDDRPPSGAGGRGHPDLNKAAAKLGISPQSLREALGPPPPDLHAAAQQLGIDEQTLKAALDASF